MCKSLGKYVRSIFMVELFSLSVSAFHHFCDGLNRFRVCVCFFFGPRAIVKRIFHQTCSPSKKIVHDYFFFRRGVSFFFFSRWHLSNILFSPSASTFSFRSFWHIRIARFVSIDAISTVVSTESTHCKKHRVTIRRVFSIQHAQPKVTNQIWIKIVVLVSQSNERNKKKRT